jgi:hypothetical protein
MEVVHFKEMNGWKYQVKNDVILDYQLRTEAGMIKGRSFEIGALADARAGTLYDKIGIGPYLIAGIYDPRNLDNIALGTWSQTNPASGKVQCFIFYRFISTLVGYDATLQGGVFTENEYALSSGQIKHFTFEHDLGLVVAYRWAAFHAEYFWLSPEYEGCESHQWMRYNLTFTF